MEPRLKITMISRVSDPARQFSGDIE